MKFKETSFNFLPVNDSEEKKRLTEIAIGSSLDSHFYESIHCRSTAKIAIERANTEGSSNSFQGEETLASDGDDNDINNPLNSTEDSESELFKIKERFDQFYDSVVEGLHEGNKEFRKSVDKFLTRYNKFSSNQRNSALQSFGTVFVSKRKGKIKVQPTAVSRRVSKVGSHQRQSNNKTKPLPNRKITLKRKHNLSEAVNANVASAKKARRPMLSNTKYPQKKKKSK